MRRSTIGKGGKKKDAIVRKVGKLEKLNCFKFGSFYSKINLILEDASGRDNEEFFEIPIYIVISNKRFLMLDIRNRN